MRAPLATAVSFAIAIASQDARAQIVNVQSVLAIEASPGLSGSITGALDWQTGNVELLRLSGAPVLRYRDGDHLVIGMMSGDFGRNAAGRYLAKTFEHLRYRWLTTDRLILETFAQHAYDQFKRLTLRGLVGVGPAVRLTNREGAQLTAGVAYMPEYERLKDDEQSDAGDSYLHHRISSYLTGALQKNKALQLVQTLYLQPRANAPSDFRVLSDTQVVISINKHLATTTGLSVAYDSRPPASVSKLDTAVKSSLTVSF